MIPTDGYDEALRAAARKLAHDIDRSLVDSIRESRKSMFVASGGRGYFIGNAQS